MEDKEQKIKISFETNADSVSGKVDGLTDKLGGATKGTDELGGAQKKAAKSSKDLGGGIEDLGGPIGGAVSGFKALLKQMWLLVANPIVAVLVAIVGALTLLFKAFTSTNDGADKLEQIMSGLSAVLDILRDRFLKVAEAIGKFMTGDFKGALAVGREAVNGFGDEVAKEFKIAADATKSLQEVEDAMRSLGVTRAKLDRDLSASKELITDETASYKDKKKAIDEVRLAEGKQTEAELENAKRKLKAITDLNALSDTSDEDLQKQATAEAAVYKLQKEQSDNKRALNKLDKKADNEEKARLKAISDERKARIKEQQAAEKTKRDAIKALLKEGFDAETALRKANEDLADKTEEQKLERQKQRAVKEIEVLKQKGIDVTNITILNAEKYAQLEADLAAKKAEEKAKASALAYNKDLEAIIANQDAEKEVRINAINEEQELLQSQFDNKILSEEEFNAKQQLLSTARKEIADKEVESAKNKLAQEEAIQGAKLGLAQQGIQLLANIFGKSKKAQKAALLASNAVGLAETAINTVSAVAKDNAASPLTFGMPWAGIHIAQGAIGAGSIIASTAKGLKELGGGNAGSATNVSSPRGSGGSETSSTPQVSFQASKENQIGNTLAKNVNEQQPIKAFVVSKEITTAQSLDNNKINSNSI